MRDKKVCFIHTSSCKPYILNIKYYDVGCIVIYWTSISPLSKDYGEIETITIERLYI